MACLLGSNDAQPLPAPCHIQALNIYADWQQSMPDSVRSPSVPKQEVLPDIAFWISITTRTVRDHYLGVRFEPELRGAECLLVIKAVPHVCGYEDHNLILKLRFARGSINV